jgi:hypothetical protein
MITRDAWIVGANIHPNECGALILDMLLRMLGNGLSRHRTKHERREFHARQNILQDSFLDIFKLPASIIDLSVLDRF